MSGISILTPGPTLWGSGEVVERLALIKVEKQKSEVKEVTSKELVKLYSGS